MELRTCSSTIEKQKRKKRAFKKHVDDSDVSLVIDSQTEAIYKNMFVQSL